MPPSTSSDSHNPASLIRCDNQKSQQRKSERKTNVRNYRTVAGFMAAAAVSDFEPRDIYEALNDVNWNQSVNDEIKSFKSLGVFQLVPRLKERKIVKLIWVFKNKLDEQGHVVRNKSRLCAQGFTQTPGIDYDETFAAVVRYSTVRLFLSLCCQKKWYIKHIDIHTAFLNAKLDEGVYTSQPPGIFDEDHPGWYWLLKRAIYGLHHSPRQWYKTIVSQLKRIQFVPSILDPKIFVHTSGTCLIILYVDDMLISASSVSIINKIIDQIAKDHKISCLGPVRHFIGMDIIYNKKEGHLYIHQNGFINKLLSKFNLLNLNTSAVPMTPGHQFSDDPLNSSLPFRSLLGSLIFLHNCSRPDISYATIRLAQFSNVANDSHWSAALQVLKYLKKTKTFGLFFTAASSIKLIGFCDASLGDPQRDAPQYSTIGYCSFLGCNLVS